MSISVREARCCLQELAARGGPRYYIALLSHDRCGGEVQWVVKINPPLSVRRVDKDWVQEIERKHPGIFRGFSEHLVVGQKPRVQSLGALCEKCRQKFDFDPSYLAELVRSRRKRALLNRLEEEARQREAEAVATARFFEELVNQVAG